MSLKKTVAELLNMPEEEKKKLARQQLKRGREILEKERAKRGLRSIQ